MRAQIMMTLTKERKKKIDSIEIYSSFSFTD
jgi:hypothetical protein